MKINYIVSLFIGCFLLIFSACDPIVDSESLDNTTTVEGVELLAIHDNPGSNKFELVMNTPGITGYWDYNLGRAFSNSVDLVFPIPGTSTFTFTGTLGAEFFTKTIDVQVDKLDFELDQDWYNLVSDDTPVGKTWVFDGTPVDGGFWWYMAPGDDPKQWETAWWNAAGDCCPPVDAAGKMHFDLNGAANFEYYSSADAAPEVGSFVLDVANQTLQVNGPNILGAEDPRGNPDGLYQIISLTEDKMILYVPTNAGGTGWVWVFKAE